MSSKRKFKWRVLSLVLFFLIPVGQYRLLYLATRPMKVSWR